MEGTDANVEKEDNGDLSVRNDESMGRPIAVLINHNNNHWSMLSPRASTTFKSFQ